MLYSRRMSWNIESIGYSALRSKSEVKCKIWYVQYSVILEENYSHIADHWSNLAFNLRRRCHLR